MIDLSEYRKIHCIGIGGIGLSAVAEVFMSRGYEVSGSDMRESEITDTVHALPNVRYYVDAYDYYHNSVYQYTRYCFMSI